jgi:hypothetical protein
MWKVKLGFAFSGKAAKKLFREHHRLNMAISYLLRE